MPTHPTHPTPDHSCPPTEPCSGIRAVARISTSTVFQVPGQIEDHARGGLLTLASAYLKLDTTSRVLLVELAKRLAGGKAS